MRVSTFSAELCVFAQVSKVKSGRFVSQKMAAKIKGLDNLAWTGDDEKCSDNHAKLRVAMSLPASLNNNEGDSKRPTELDMSRPEENGKVPFDFDDVLPYVGEFGPYQIVLFFLTAPFCFFLAFAYFSQVFITLVPDHTCHVDQLDNSGLNISQK